MEYQQTRTRQIPELDLDTWTLFIDGASSDSAAGSGLALTSHDKQQYTYALRSNFDASNNEAKYETMLAGLKIAKTMGVMKL
jgi:ribonuclease HI